MTKRFPPHPSDELLEEYFFHRLAEARVAEIEEHLLTCEDCRIAVQELDTFILTMKTEAARPATSQLWQWSQSSNIAWSAATLVVVAALVVFWTRPLANPTPADVILSSIRGIELSSEAPAGKSLRLHIDVPDLVPGQAYQVALVDAAGRSVWIGTASDADGEILAQVQRRLMSGMYWVRLYDSQNRQLREFGMSVK